MQLTNPFIRLGIQQGIEQGIEKGRHEGEVELVLRQLNRRLGALIRIILHNQGNTQASVHRLFNMDCRYAR